ncbi:MAG: DUF72 domain-containing protein [Sphaerochaetaceae bacterium]|nr:DUF72 domain-containing protein [Sphaerochaetaceae bacterium]
MGTSSFIYPSWKSLVYSSAYPEHPLTEYALQFPMVEIDRWFWSLGKDSAGLPDPDTVAEYHESTPDEFRFITKCPNALTLKINPHTGAKNRFFLSHNLMEEYLASLEPLTAKIGMHMLQFGYLNRSMFLTDRQFLSAVRVFRSSVPDYIPLGVEIRNPGYLSYSFFSALREMNISPVLLSGYWMPDVVETIGRYQEAFSPVMVLRLHGENRSDIEEATGNRWDRIVFDRSTDIARIGSTLQELSQEHQIYVAVNNHFEGSAPLSIMRLRQAMGDSVW